MLTERGYDMQLRNKRGETALHHTILRANYNWAVVLTSEGIDVNVPDLRRNETALHWAAQLRKEEGSRELVKLLLSSGANVMLEGLGELDLI